MNKNPGPLLRDIRNIKKNNTITFSTTSKELPISGKDLKKARSSEQLILNGFLNNKNEKIKNIDQKLQLHQEEIQRNNSVIEELTNTLEKLRDQIIKERAKTDSEEKKAKHLLEEMERTNKMLRSKNIKIEDLSKKLQHSERQLEASKMSLSKMQETVKINGQLKKQISNLEQVSNNRKEILVEKQKQIQRLRERVLQFGGIKAECEKVKSALLQKDIEIGNLNSYLSSLQDKNNRNQTLSEEEMKSLNSKLRQKQDRLRITEKELAEIRKSQIKLKEKVNELEDKNRRMNTQIQSKVSFQKILKNQLDQLKRKFQDTTDAMRNRERQQRQSDLKIENLKGVIQDLKKKLEIEQSEGAVAKEMGEKIANLQKKTVNLSQIYKSILPQIQCPYGHELKDPVTVIPCGHNYCLGCKKGYGKQCMMCHGKLKIEAIYRNELMDDIMSMVKGIRQILELLK